MTNKMKQPIKKLCRLNFKWILTLASLAACVAQAQSEAPLSSFYTPSYRGQSTSESAFWNDSFTIAYGGPNNAGSLAPIGVTLANASVMQTTPGAFIIGGSAGDIYSFSSVNTFVLNYLVSNPANFPTGISDVVFQTETVGSGLDYSSVALIYNTGAGTQTLLATRNELYRDTEITGFGPSSDVLSEWEWSLPVSDDVNSFTITFNGSGTSVGLERVMLDVSPIPEPGTLALAGLGLGLVGLCFRRQPLP